MTEVAAARSALAGPQVWDLWYPQAAAQGLSFARGRLAATDVLLVHAAPPLLDVTAVSYTHLTLPTILRV